MAGDLSGIPIYWDSYTLPHTMGGPKRQFGIADWVEPIMKRRTSKKSKLLVPMWHGDAEARGMNSAALSAFSVLCAHSWRAPPLALALPCFCPNSCPPRNPIVIPSPAVAAEHRPAGILADAAANNARITSSLGGGFAVAVARPLPLALAASTPGLLVPWWFGLSPQVVLGEALAVVPAVFAGGWAP